MKRIEWIESGGGPLLFAPCAPKRYETAVEAQVTALACSEPPPGAQRWTVALLTEAARRHPKMKTISRETIRRILKKTSSNPGAN